MFYLMWMFRTPSLGESISVALRDCFEEVGEGVRLYTSLQQSRQAIGTSKIIVKQGKPAEKAMAPHSSTLAWKIPWMEEPGGLQSMGSLELDTTEWLHFHFSLSCTGGGNGNPLQCSCLENPRDRGAWWATVYGVTQSRTWLKWLSSSSSSKHPKMFVKLALDRWVKQQRNIKMQNG